MKLMVDLCSGTKSASISMRDAGWNVISIDIDNRFDPDICADVRQMSGKDITNNSPLLVWASPPCDDYAREFMPWSKTGNKPDKSIWLACRRIITELQPEYYVIENVIGAQRYWGKANQHIGPFYLWTNLPKMSKIIRYKKKESYSSSNPEMRAAIPYQISERVRLTIEKTIRMEL